MRTAPTLALLLIAALAGAPPARADLKTKAAREAAEYALQKFGKAAAREGAETLAERIGAAASRHGDDVFAAVRRVGPKALNLADEAGESAPSVLRLLSKHGDDAAAWVLERPAGRRLFGELGEEAAEALVRHKGIAEPLLDDFGRAAAGALNSLGPRGGRRLAMMSSGGELAAIGRQPELMGVIARYGDPAMEFIWKHKGALAVGTTLAAFLADPGPFLDGTNRLAETVAEDLFQPVVHEAAGVLAWPIRAASVLAVLAAGGMAYLAVRHPRIAAGLARMAIGRAAAGLRK